MLQAIDAFFWGPGTLALLLGTGAFLTLRTHFLPWRDLGWALRSALGREAHQPKNGGVSPFAALMTSLAATIGTGNIVGVATALTVGGPGALVWMEVSALLGLSTKFAECMLAVKYRRRERSGRWVGGPMYVMEATLGRPGKFLGTCYALFAAAAAFGIGALAQANAIAGALDGLPPKLVGAATAVLALVILCGGIRRVSAVSAWLVPAMAVFYLTAALSVIFGHLDALPGTILLILKSAVSPQAAAGGVAGTVTASALDAARWGVARGVFSNEAGLGSAAMAAASADTDSPVRQGYISMTGNFFDTCVVCTVTGLAICCSGVLGTADAAGRLLDGGALTVRAFETALGPLGGRLVGAAIVLFAFSSVLGWEYQGETAFAYLLHGRGRQGYRLAFALAVFFGAVARLEVVYQLSDICNALMCLPNLLCLLALSGTVRREALEFQREIQNNSGKKR
jgi:AGCS family alanine or glycine:cation symporter